MSVRLTPNFTVEELCVSAKAKALGISNAPSLAIMEHLERLAVELEKVRSCLGDVPLKIHSAYRAPLVNAAVGGAKNSYHMLGLAADFDPPAGWTHDEAQHAIGRDVTINFDLVLEEKAKDGAHWLHFQIPKDGAKGRRLLKDAELDKQGGEITRTSAG